MNSVILWFLNKVDELSKDELEKVKAVVKKLQPSAKIIETNYSDVDFREIMNTKAFDFEKCFNFQLVGLKN